MKRVHWQLQLRLSWRDNQYIGITTTLHMITMPRQVYCVLVRISVRPSFLYSGYVFIIYTMYLILQRIPLATSTAMCGSKANTSTLLQLLVLFCVVVFVCFGKLYLNTNIDIFTAPNGTY